MKLRVEVNGTFYTLDFRNGDGQVMYALSGAESRSEGTASVAAAGPGTYSVLVGQRSFSVQVARAADSIEVHVDGCRYLISISDARDRSSHAARVTTGPLEIRSQMPGKIVKLLVQPGARVENGQGLLVIEAMKMQNEIKSSKEGIVTQLLVSEGDTVSAGQRLVVIT
jgi:biotin carboxyl carrier protein